jgi:hypothetical protein
MANLDKLLRKIELNKEKENEVKTFPLTIGEETFDVKSMTRSEKRQFIYAQETGKSSMTAGDIVKKMKPFIYKALDLKELAVKAKDAGFIQSYYDVVEALFEPEQIIEIIAFITEINGISEKVVEDELEDLKKP